MQQLVSQEQWENLLVFLPVPHATFFIASLAKCSRNTVASNKVCVEDPKDDLPLTPQKKKRLTVWQAAPMDLADRGFFWIISWTLFFNHMLCFDHPKKSCVSVSLRVDRTTVGHHVWMLSMWWMVAQQVHTRQADTLVFCLSLSGASCEYILIRQLTGFGNYSSKCKFWRRNKVASKDSCGKKPRIGSLLRMPVSHGGRSSKCSTVAAPRLARPALLRFEDRGQQMDLTTQCKVPDLVCHCGCSRAQALHFLAVMREAEAHAGNAWAGAVRLKGDVEVDSTSFGKFYISTRASAFQQQIQSVQQTRHEAGEHAAKAFVVTLQILGAMERTGNSLLHLSTPRVPCLTSNFIEKKTLHAHFPPLVFLTKMVALLRIL